MINARILLTLVPVVLCAIPQAAWASRVVPGTYTLTQDLPTVGGTDVPTFTWTTGPLEALIEDGTLIPFLSDPVLNSDAIADSYTVADVPGVIYQDGAFVELSLDYFYFGDFYNSTNSPACAAGSDQTGCTFSVAVNYVFNNGCIAGGLQPSCVVSPSSSGTAGDPPGFAPDTLDLSGFALGTPEPSTAPLVMIGLLGLALIRRFRFN